jgi:hypothetical protein
VACGATPPAFTLTGTIEADQPLSVTYHWVRSTGSATSPATIKLAAGKAQSVIDKFTPPSDSFTGSDTLDITSPFQVSQSLPIAVTCTLPTLTVTSSGSLPNGTVGSPYTATVQATGGKPPYTWLASGLPSGLAIGSGNGVISGTPGTAGTFMVVVTASDSQSPASTASAQLTLVVNEAAPSVSVASVSSSPGSPLTGTCGSSRGGFTVSAVLTSTASTTATYHWSRSDGTSTGASTVGVSSDGATVSDNVSVTSNNWSLTDTVEVTSPTAASRSISLSYSCTFPKLAITTGELPNGSYLGNSPHYSATVSATGGDGVYHWSASGLPKGLSIDSGSGVISGDPGQYGTFTVTVTVTDGEATPQSASATYSLTILNMS